MEAFAVILVVAMVLAGPAALIGVMILTRKVRILEKQLHARHLTGKRHALSKAATAEKPAEAPLEAVPLQHEEPPFLEAHSTEKEETSLAQQPVPPEAARKGPPPINMHFISDTGGNMMLEVYHNPPNAVPDYASIDPLTLHIAFMVDDVKGTCQKLIAAGATVASEITVTESGDKLAMLRDPWGVPIQILKRANPMLTQ